MFGPEWCAGNNVTHKRVALPMPITANVRSLLHCSRLIWMELFPFERPSYIMQREVGGSWLFHTRRILLIPARNKELRNERVHRLMHSLLITDTYYANKHRERKRKFILYCSTTVKQSHRMTSFKDDETQRHEIFLSAYK